MGRLGSSRKKKKRTLTGDILEPIRDQRKRGNLCTGQRKRNSPSGRPQGTPTHHRSREERRSHRTETPDAGAAFQERGGGRRARQTRTDSRGLSRDSQPQASVTEQPGCAHSAGLGKPDAGQQTWNYSDDQRDRRHQDDKVAGPGQERDSGQGSREAARLEGGPTRLQRRWRAAGPTRWTKGPEMNGPGPGPGTKRCFPANLPA